MSSGASMRRQVEREMGALVDQAEKNDLAVRQPLLDLAVTAPSSIATDSAPSMTARGSPPSISRMRLCVRQTGTKRLSRSAIRATDPFGLAASQPGPLEAGMRIEIRRSHPSKTDTRRRRRNRAQCLCDAQSWLEREFAMISLLYCASHHELNRNEVYMSDIRIERNQAETCRARAGPSHARSARPMSGSRSGSGGGRDCRGNRTEHVAPEPEPVSTIALAQAAPVGPACPVPPAPERSPAKRRLENRRKRRPRLPGRRSPKHSPRLPEALKRRRSR